MITYPLSLGDVSPGDLFKKLEPKRRSDGLPDGVHTGGVWLSPDEKEVYKPLDAKPCPNATERVRTDEARCLVELDGIPGILTQWQWRVETLNGRDWLVLPRLNFWPQDFVKESAHPVLEDFLLIEQAVIEMNRRGWEYNDLPQLAYGERGPLLMDFSIAHKPEKWRQGWHGDEFRMDRWWELMECPGIAKLRQLGRHIHHIVQLPDYQLAVERARVENAFYGVSEEERQQHVHIYASKHRPMSAVWARIEGAKLLDGTYEPESRVYTWVVSKEPLDDETVSRYELIWAWSPWP